MNPMRGIALKLVAVLLFVSMSALIKAASDEVPPGEAVFFRATFAIPVILLWLASRNELRAGLTTSNPLGHVWRGVIGTAAMGLGFAGLALLPLSEVQAINYATPILVVIFASMFLGEPVRLVRLGAVALGMVGVMIVLYPRLSVLGRGDTELLQTIGALAVLGSALCAALAQIFVRKMVQTESVSSIVFWFSISAAVLALFTIPFGWVWPSAEAAAMLVLAGLLGGIGQICLTSAYRFADVSVIAPFDYASMLFAILFGYAFFGEVPTWTMISGAALIVSAGVLIIWRERQLGLKRGAARPALPPGGR